MATLPSFRSLTAVVVLSMAIAACGDDNNPAGGGTPDTTPPTMSSVTPVDSLHFNVVFNEPVTKSSAEDDGHYVIVEASTPSPAPAAPRTWAQAPGDTLRAATAVLKSDNKTVAITTEGSMAGLPFTLTVRDVADTHGNRINTPVEMSFTGSNDADVTAPEIVSRSPAPNATGVPIGAAVTIQFSEPVRYISFEGGVTWASSGGPVAFNIENNGASFTLTPASPLSYATRYTITMNHVQDEALNTIPSTNWSFTTTSMTDHTPPTLVSTIPANLATHVNVNTNLSLTFSEAVYQNAFNVMLSPDVGPGVETWSNGGKTVTFDPDTLLLDNQQYTFTIYPDGVRDLAGNGIVGVTNVVFTTGNTLNSGSIAGTISGDPNSNVADDPTGAIVIAADDMFDTVGSAMVAGNNSYTIGHLPDGVYYLLAIMDSNGDGVLYPDLGDAIGEYGINLGNDDFDPDSVVVLGGSHKTGINFRLYDSSAIAGAIEYEGAFAEESHSVFVGLFDTAGFNLATSTPVAGWELYWPDTSFLFNSLFDGFDDDTYYLAAFLDVDDDYAYDPAVDPAGVYDGGPPYPIQVQGGDDFFDLVLVLEDPIGMKPSASISWRVETAPSPALRRVRDMVRASVAASTK